MRLYNTLSRSVAEFQPLKDNTAYIYSCGPTVYDHAHIGNLSAFIYADTLRRAVGARGTQAVHGMNYTDVDDKTIRRSHEKYPELEPMAALRKLTDEYIDLFLQDMRLIGNDTSAITFLRATDPKVIQGMRDMITKLYTLGFAYVADDGVYFSIEAYQRSGKQYGQLLTLTANNTSEARIQNDEYDKASVHDFALWKTQKPGEPAWPFELDGHDLAGRPGWHIECSVMSRQILGQPFDIHTGGVDLIFPHHENEIAQSTAGEENSVMSHFFVHNEHMFVSGVKMSKSLGNFYTLRDVLDKGYDPLAFRVLVLQSHYRSQSHYSWENLEAAQNRLDNWRQAAVLQWQPLPALTANEEPISSVFDDALESIIESLEDDVRTPAVMTTLSDVFSVVSEKTLRSNEVAAFGRFLKRVDELLGLQLASIPDINETTKTKIKARSEARRADNWSESDNIRDELKAQHIGLRDTAHGTVWYRL